MDDLIKGEDGVYRPRRRETTTPAEDTADAMGAIFKNCHVITHVYMGLDLASGPDETVIFEQVDPRDFFKP